MSAMLPPAAADVPAPAATGVARLSGVSARVPATLCSVDTVDAPSKSMSSRFSMLLCGAVPLAAATDAAMPFSAAFCRCSWMAARWISSAPNRPLSDERLGRLVVHRGERRELAEQLLQERRGQRRHGRRDCRLLGQDDILTAVARVSLTGSRSRMLGEFRVRLTFATSRSPDSSRQYT